MDTDDQYNLINELKDLGLGDSFDHKIINQKRRMFNKISRQNTVNNFIVPNLPLNNLYENSYYSSYLESQ